MVVEYKKDCTNLLISDRAGRPLGRVAKVAVRTGPPLGPVLRRKNAAFYVCGRVCVCVSPFQQAVICRAPAQGGEQLPQLLLHIRP